MKPLINGDDFDDWVEKWMPTVIVLLVVFFILLIVGGVAYDLIQGVPTRRVVIEMPYR